MALIKSLNNSLPANIKKYDDYWEKRLKLMKNVSLLNFWWWCVKPNDNTLRISIHTTSQYFKMKSAQIDDSKPAGRHACEGCKKWCTPVLFLAVSFVNWCWNFIFVDCSCAEVQSISLWQSQGHICHSFKDIAGEKWNCSYFEMFRFTNFPLFSTTKKMKFSVLRLY